MTSLPAHAAGVKAGARPLEIVLARLPDARPSGSGHSAPCPAHDDHNPSLSVWETDDGGARVCCHTGCEPPAVLAALGLTEADLVPSAPASRARPSKPATRAHRTADEAVASLSKKLGPDPKTWTYADAAGEPVGLVARWDRDGRKEIRPVSRHKDGWRVEAMPRPRPLYRLPDLAGAESVVVTEGEKCADIAARLGFPATTSAGGAAAPHLTDWSPLAGKSVVILPDADVAGRKYASQVAATLATLDPPAVARVVELPDLPEKGDIANWVAARPGATDADLKAELDAVFAAQPQPPDPSAELATPVEPREDRPWPATLDDAAFIGPLGHYARLVAPFTEADPGAILAQSLLLFGAAAGRSPHA